MILNVIIVFGADLVIMCIILLSLGYRLFDLDESSLYIPNCSTHCVNTVNIVEQLDGFEEDYASGV